MRMRCGEGSLVKEQSLRWTGRGIVLNSCEFFAGVCVGALVIEDSGEMYGSLVDCCLRFRGRGRVAVNL